MHSHHDPGEGRLSIQKQLVCQLTLHPCQILHHRVNYKHPTVPQTMRDIVGSNHTPLTNGVTIGNLELWWIPFIDRTASIEGVFFIARVHPK